ncbi:MAG: zf-HC2 domain-containing protein [Clostridia bacterium]|nr:zf-HC2 domain-containing protein [Clostridia bacterium]
MKLECNVIRDLMPSYIDGLCSEDSKLLIKEHLCECKECKGVYDAMSSSYGENTIPEVNEAEVIKKVNQKYKMQGIRNNIVSVIATILILILLIVFIAPKRTLNVSEFEVEYTNYSLSEGIMFNGKRSVLKESINIDNIVFPIASDEDTAAILDEDDDMVINYIKIEDHEIICSEHFIEEEPYACIVTVKSEYPISSSDITPVFNADGTVTIKVDSVKTNIFGGKSSSGSYSIDYIFFCSANNIVVK